MVMYSNGSCSVDAISVVSSVVMLLLLVVVVAFGCRMKEKLSFNDIQDFLSFLLLFNERLRAFDHKSSINFPFVRKFIEAFNALPVIGKVHGKLSHSPRVARRVVVVVRIVVGFGVVVVVVVVGILISMFDD